MISREKLKEYDKNGYFFIKDLFSIDELQPLINESENFSTHPSKFSVKDAKGNPAQLISWTHLANDFIGLLPRLKKMVSIPEQILDKEYCSRNDNQQRHYRRFENFRNKILH